MTCNGTTATSAGIVETDGKLCLALAFPATKKATPATGDAAIPVAGLFAAVIASLGAARLSRRCL